MCPYLEIGKPLFCVHRYYTVQLEMLEEARETSTMLVTFLACGLSVVVFDVCVYLQHMTINRLKRHYSDV